MSTHTLPGLPLHAVDPSPTLAMRHATGADDWPHAEQGAPAPGDLYLLGLAGEEIALALVVEVTEHWAAVLPAAVATRQPAGSRLLPPVAGLPALDVWTGYEATVTIDLLARRLGAVASRRAVSELLSAPSPVPLTEDLVKVWAAVNLGIDTGR